MEAHWLNKGFCADGTTSLKGDSEVQKVYAFGRLVRCPCEGPKLQFLLHYVTEVASEVWGDLGEVPYLDSIVN